MRTLPGTRLYSSFEEPTEGAVSGTHLQPVPSAAHARTGQTSLLLAGGRGSDKAYFSLSHLLPVKAGQTVKASLYASYTAPSHTVDRVLQAAGMAAAAYSQSAPVTPALPEQARGKRAVPYLGIGLALTPTVKPWRRSTPKAYLRYSVYNADTVLVASDTRPVDRTARDNWQELSFAKTMPVDGFVQLTFVNESPQSVRVDDLALLVDAPAPDLASAPARRYKGGLVNDFDVQYSGNCMPNYDLPDIPITSPPPPPEYPPIFFPDPPSYPDPDPTPNPDPDPGYPGDPSPSSPVSTLDVTVGNLSPCATQVMLDLKAIGQNSPLTGGNIAHLINGINSSSSVHVTFTQQANLKSPTTQKDDRAQTVPLGGSNYNIVMNANYLQGAGSATDLAVAADMIHEMLHVYMTDWANAHNVDPNLSLDLLMDSYSGSVDQHAAMTQIVSSMGQALLAYYNTTFFSSSRLNTINQNYCEYLIWGDLTGTALYQSKATDNPAWALQVQAIKTAEQHPDEAGRNLGTNGDKIPSPQGNQPCK